MKSKRTPLHTITVWMLVLSLSGMGFPPLSGAVMIGTKEVIHSERQSDLAKIDTILANDNVRKQLEKMGVNPVAAQERVTALSDGELSMLRDQLEELPAGGTSALAVIGIVFIVLIILEVIGVLDIFKKV